MVPMDTDEGAKSSPRLAYHELSPEALAALRSLKAQLSKSPLGRPMVELIYQRVSQINGCTYCLDMHGKALRACGETNLRLETLAHWRSSSLFNERERAALGWAESVTDIAVTRAPDDVYEPLKHHFTDVEISDLTFAIALINALNRLAISMRQ